MVTEYTVECTAANMWVVSGTPCTLGTTPGVRWRVCARQSLHKASRRPQQLVFLRHVAAASICTLGGSASAVYSLVYS